MTGYSWSTPAVDMGAVTVNGPEGQARDHDLAGWDAIDWRGGGGGGRRLGARGFKASRGAELGKSAELREAVGWGRAETPVRGERGEPRESGAPGPGGRRVGG